MKLSVNPKRLPFFTLGAGGIGLVLRIWYFSTRDAKGLLPAAHFANTVSYLVLAAALAVIVLCVRQLPDRGRYQKIFPGGYLPAAGCVLGAFGVVYACISDAASHAVFSGIALVLGLLAAFSLVLIGLLRLKGNRPSVYLYVVLVLYLVVHVLIQVRIWSKETQQTVIFFPLLASLSLMVYTYFHAQLTVRQEGLRPLVFFQQAALLLCCLSLNCQGYLFYLGMALWLGCDLLPIPKKRSGKEET